MLHRLVLVSMFASIAMLSPVTADPRRGEQNEAREDMKAGRIKRLPEIEAIVVPRMRGMQYLGPEYDPVAQVYRLKFINRDRVIFVDVDARTGNVIRQR